MAIIGPGSVQEELVRPDPVLQGASQYEVVKVHNPLTDDFVVQVAQSIPFDVQFQINNTEGKQPLSETDVTRTYGVNLRGPDQTQVSKKHVLNKTIIKAGQSMNFRGDIAQVAVRQLVNEIMQQRNQTKFMADPVQRNLVEKEIIISRGTMEDLMNNNLQSVDTQINQAVEKLNENTEESFPGLGESQTGAPASKELSDSVKTAAPRGKKPSGEGQ